MSQHLPSPQAAGVSGSSGVIFVISLELSPAFPEKLSLCWRSGTNGKETGLFLLLAPDMDHVGWVATGTGLVMGHCAPCNFLRTTQLLAHHISAELP